MKVKELIEKLKEMKQEKEITVACDEEWNAIFGKFEINENGDTGDYVIFGLSGTEINNT